jgi:hypothetical protein
LDRLLRPISGIGVCLSTCVGFLQKLSKHPAVMYRYNVSVQFGQNQFRKGVG